MSCTVKEAWENNNIPDTQKQGNRLKDSKKGTSQLPPQLDINLNPDLLHKMVALIKHIRFTTAIEPFLRKNQAGFRSNRSCIDNINKQVITLKLKQDKNPRFLLSCSTSSQLLYCTKHSKKPKDTTHLTYQSVLIVSISYRHTAICEK